MKPPLHQGVQRRLGPLVFLEGFVMMAGNYGGYHKTV